MGYFLIKIPSSSLKCIGQIYPRYVIARPRNLRINFALSSDLISSPRRSFFLPRLAAILFRNWLFVARVGGLRKVVETEPFRIDPSSKYLICSLETRVILDGIEFWDRKRRQKAILMHQRISFEFQHPFKFRGLHRRNCANHSRLPLSNFRLLILQSPGLRIMASDSDAKEMRKSCDKKR